MDSSRPVRQAQPSPDVGPALAPNASLPSSSAAAPILSVVVPTRNEAANVEALVARLEAALADTPFELIFVDDSDDGTDRAISALVPHTGWGLHLIHRPPGQRRDGLGGAVIEGLLVAQADYVCVMDADLQHPPELIPELLSVVHAEHDLAIASRYDIHGDAAEFNMVRSAISHLFTATAHALFRSSLANLRDPLSGFFVVRKAALDIEQLRPQGFKILLEILVRTPGLRITEIGFHFGKRHAGHSKASFREGLRYIGHLMQLRLTPTTIRFAKFLLVGLSGIFVNMALLALATELLGLHYLLSAILATQGSSIWNFGLTEYWVFSARERPQGRTMRLALFVGMNNAALLLRGPMLVLLTSGLGVYYLVSNLVSLVALTAVRYAVADAWIWGSRKIHYGRVFNYDIHGIVRVQSDVWLPELERFLVSAAQEQPTLRVRIGKVTTGPHEGVAPGAMGLERITYKEGTLGFAAAIQLGRTIEITASPILRHSPHVLYTNVVEPVLRWTFVEKGYALVHGACITVGEQAYLVTARTDTGKTTTMLRILDRQRRASDRVSFMSDDLTLVSRDGEVLTYPKPLTISYHTMRAINSAMLTWRERLVLPLQSRIHSRSGRRFAFLLTKTNLPVATINTIVQLLVPPPKYHVQRLVPHAKLARRARLAAMFVIERGGDGDAELDEQAAFDTLMANSEDAYGFPPYPTIKSFLHHRGERDLRDVEREIVAAVLQNRPAILLRSSVMDWAARIASQLGTSSSRTAVDTLRS